MSKLTDEFRKLKIYNQHEFSRKDMVYITYHPQTTGLGSRCARWVVCGVGFSIDPNGHWSDYGNKPFMVWGREQKQSALLEAQEWAGKQYGIKSWAKTPYGSWMDAEFVKKRVAELKAQLKQLEASHD